MQHDETDWCLASIDRAEPSIPAKMSLGNRKSIWSHEPFLTTRLHLEQDQPFLFRPANPLFREKM
jgi:hypothetical protein